MKLTAEEKETIISFNEADGTADIEVFNGRLFRQICKAAEKYPDEVTIKENSDGSCRVILPKKWIKIRPPMKLTEEQRAERAAKMKENSVKS